MCAQSAQPDPRDEAMNRLLAQALKPSAAASAGACPDAELVAAYIEQGLAAGHGKGPLQNVERVQLESHFANCARCQQVLATLGSALEAPADATVLAPAVEPATPPRTARHAPALQRWLWWLSPAFGAAAAALLWMALHPAAPEPVQTAANFPAAAEREARVLNAPAASPAQSEAPPAAAARRDAQASERISKAGSAEPVPAQGTREQASGQLAAPPAGAVPRALPRTAQPSENAVAGVLPRSSAAPQGAPAAPQTPTPAVPPAMTQAVTITEQLPLVNSSSATLGGTVSNQTVLDLPVSGRNVAPLNLYAYSFTSPGGGVQWRIGVAGLIQKSTDNGQTWQQQASGVTADLIAGSAASTEVAWIVGRNGVILRTTDGQRWERVAAPAEVTAWAAVVAHDAMNATVVADDLRRFSTQDGGQTWTQQP